MPVALADVVPYIPAALSVLFAIISQNRGEPLKLARLVLMPVGVLGGGVVALARTPFVVAPATVVVLAAVAALVAAVGVGQGVLMRMERRNGVLWGRMPAANLWWWAGATTIVVAGAAVGTGLHAGGPPAALWALVMIGINRAAHSAVVIARATSTRIPFAPARRRRVPDPSATTPRSPTVPGTTDRQTVPAGRSRPRLEDQGR